MILNILGLLCRHVFGVYISAIAISMFLFSLSMGVNFLLNKKQAPESSKSQAPKIAGCFGFAPTGPEENTRIWPIWPSFSVIWRFHHWQAEATKR